MHAGKIDVAARTEPARRQDFAANPVVAFSMTRTCMTPLSTSTMSPTEMSLIRPS